MSETKRDYQVSRAKPPVHSCFKKGQSGNRRGPRPKSLPCRVQDMPCLGEAVPLNNRNFGDGNTAQSDGSEEASSDPLRPAGFEKSGLGAGAAAEVVTA